MREAVVATRNRGKLRELARLLEGLDLELHLMDDFPGLGEIDETGSTFEENALKKAKEVAAATGLIAIADDSGLAVEALQGKPGVMSARYAGDKASDSDNNMKLLAELADVPEDRRKAAFVCVLAAADPEGRHVTAEGRCRGIIAAAPKGEKGFGYDPLFYLPQYGCTMAEISTEVKNSISHRGRAAMELKKLLPGFLEGWKAKGN